jgi:hypothetical protein
METGSNLPPKRRWGWWAVLALNLLGLLLILPLLKVTWPLITVWWTTRSQASFQSHQSAPPIPSVAPEVLPAAATDSPVASENATPGGTNAADFQALTNQLGLLATLSDADLGQIVAKGFGTNSQTSGAHSSKFDLASAAFDSISRTNVIYEGKTYYGYRVNLVDQHGNHQTNIDCFTEPNLEYERSLATLDLISRSPQLKRVYQAMAATLAEKAGDESSTNASTNGPAFRLGEP